MKKDLAKVVQKEAEELLSLMGTKAKAEVSYDTENESLEVNVATDEETGLLIGRHGETLNSLQAVLGMMVRQETGEWKRVLVNVGDWREKKEELPKKGGKPSFFPFDFSSTRTAGVPLL